MKKRGVIIKVAPEFEEYLKRDVIPVMRQFQERMCVKMKVNNVTATRLIAIKHGSEKREKKKKISDVFDFV